jgi:hypothetical protein
MKLLIMQFSPTCHFISPWSKYSPQHHLLYIVSSLKLSALV